MKYSLMAFALALTVMGSSAAVAGVESDKMSLLGRALASSSVQKVLLADGYIFRSIVFVEADDGDTEPLYLISTEKGGGNDALKCYTIGFDTDEPTEEPRLDVSESCDL